jgi:hypothetical protein
MSRRESGQAAVETAISMPLVLFCVLGALQLFMMFNGRILTQLAAYKAARAGSLNHGNCDRMIDAALVQVLPAIESFMRPPYGGGPNRPGAKLAAAYARRRFNTYDPSYDRITDGGKDTMASGTIIWLVRDLGPRALAGVEDDDFDMGLAVQRLEVKAIFWFPMRIPFANWVMSKMYLAHFSVTPYTAVNPLVSPQTAKWTATAAQSVDSAIISEMATRMNRGEFVFPITATYTMRMMTPAKQDAFRTKNCPPTPAAL